MFSNDYESQAALIKVLEDNYKLIKCSYDVASYNSIEAYRASVVTFVFDSFSDTFNTSWLVSRISEQGLLDTVPVAFTTAEVFAEFGKLGYEIFACDILPIGESPEFIMRRMSNLVEMYQLKQQIGNLTQIHSKRLMMQANKLREQTQKMHKLNFDLIELLVAAIESRDVESGQHIKRIRYFVKALLEVVATECPEYNLTDEQVEIISLASAVHDIGKISIPDSILLKPARLTKEEFELMKAHTTKGARLLNMLDGIGDSVYFQYCREICLCHHERWDGKGYPNGLKGDDIPISAQVVSVADCYDALTSERPYKHALSHEEAVNLIKTGACGAFSPEIMKCFDWCLSDFKRIEEEFKNNPPPSELQDSLYDNMEIATQNFTEAEEKQDLPRPVLEKYEQLIIDSYDIIIESNLERDEFILHKGDWASLFGYIPRNALEALAQLSSCCHPDDLAAFTQNFTIEEFKKLAADGSKKTRAEFRIVPNGQEIFVSGFVSFCVNEKNELVNLCAAFNGYKSSLFISSVKPRCMTHDNLTGLMMESSLQKEFELYLQNAEPDSVGLMVYIDIDGMTYINNTSGYEFGNSIIRGVADRLVEATETKDCFLCRLNGDKFCVFVKNIKRKVDAVLFIEALHKALRKDYKTATGEASVTVTIGVSRYPEDGTQYRDLLSDAEYASQISKLNGSDMYSFYNPTVDNYRYYEKMFFYGVYDTDLSGKEDTQERYIPVYDKKSGVLIGYDYLPFSILGDVLPIPSDVFRDALSSLKNKKHLSIIQIKELIAKIDGILEKQGSSPLFSIFTFFADVDILAVLQELRTLYEAYPEACKYVCLCLPQQFLDNITWRNLKSFADSVRTFGFSLGAYLVCDKYLNMLCLSEGVFDRIILASEFTEKALTGLYPAEFLSQTINNLASYSSTVTIPSILSEANAETLFSFDCVGFSVYDSIISGTDEMLGHFSKQYINTEIHKRVEEASSVINPVAFLFALNKSDCIIIQADYATNTITYSNNAPRILGYGLTEYVNNDRVDYSCLVAQEDLESVVTAIADAKANQRCSFCSAGIRTVAGDETSYPVFNLSFLPITDNLGNTVMLQVIILPQG